MMIKKLKKIVLFILCVVIIIVGFPMTAKADMGPKPSVTIRFENMGDELCYGTLLSKNESAGSASAWDGNDDHARYRNDENYPYGMFNYDIWKAFVEYEDIDGYYFLQQGWLVSETKEISWTYYPPSNFKILLYYPETQTFIVSDIYEKYAFDSYFTVNMEGINISSVEHDEDINTNVHIKAYRSYEYGWEILSLIARIVITILIEMLIALMFGYWHKKQLLLLIAVNGGTQIILNILLNIINYKSGLLAFFIFYIMLEILVFVIEAIIFFCLLGRISDKKRAKWLAIPYALVSNFVSFIAGIMVVQWLPGIF